MSTKVLVCDDSRMARKQLMRCFPEDWAIDILQAEDGQQALNIISEHSPELMFLDLNMPVLDGYETLEEIADQGLDISVIVISGDIQPEAQQRVLALGALNFVKKPISKETLVNVLRDAGYYSSIQDDESSIPIPVSHDNLDDEKVFLDACQEISNVAMGRAGDLLARFLKVFIELPIPKVNHIELSELKMALQFADQDQNVSSVCQGFIGPGVSGEALILFNDSCFNDIANLMNYKGKIDDSVELELLMDIANIIIGSCLKGISDQLSTPFSLGHPLVLGQHVKIADLIQSNVKRWNKALSIEINYKIENESINCDLLLLFTEDSIEPIKEKLSYIVN